MQAQHQEIAGSSQSNEVGLTTRESWQGYMSPHSIGEVAVANIVEPLTLETVPNATLAVTALDVILKHSSGEEVENVRKRVQQLRDEAGGTADFRNTFSFDQDAHNALNAAIMSDPKVLGLIADRGITGAHMELLARWPEVSKVFTEGIQRGISRGYIPENVQTRIFDALHSTVVRVIDGSILDASASGAGAMYEETTDEIFIRHNHVPPEEYIGLLIHELTHKISGGTFHDIGGARARVRIGFGSKDKIGTYRRVPLTEVATEQTALGILDGDFDTLDPERRRYPNTTYLNYRKTYALFAELASGIITPQSLIRSHLEDTAPGVNCTVEREKFVREVVTAYGIGALKKLDVLFSLSDHINWAEFEPLLRACITSPTVDDAGHVTKQGSISFQDVPKRFAALVAVFSR